MKPMMMISQLLLHLMMKKKVQMEREEELNHLVQQAFVD
jgi:hypothetical protein